MTRRLVSVIGAIAALGVLAAFDDPQRPEPPQQPDAIGCAPGAPDCAVENWISPLHRSDPRFDAGLDVLQNVEVTHGAPAPGIYFEVVLLAPPRGSGVAMFCSGVLVAPSAILTARHCKTDGVAVPGGRVYFGDSSRRIVATRIAETVSAPAEAASDLAIIWLKTPAPAPPNAEGEGTAMSRGVSTSIAKVASAASVNASVAARIVGFGFTETGSRGEKRYADVAVVTRDCTASFVTRDGRTTTDSAFYGCDAGDEIVAGAVDPTPKIGVDTCGGDSGGPIFVAPSAEAASHGGYVDAMKPGEQRYLLAGVTSRAVNTPDVPSGGGCGNGGIYERLSGANLRWIISELATHNEQLRQE